MRRLWLDGRTDLLEGAGEEAQHEEDVEVRDEGGDDSDDDHRPLAEQEHRLAPDTIRQRREAHRAEHDADRQDRLRQVFEVRALAHQVPLQTTPTAPFHVTTRSSAIYRRGTARRAVSVKTVLNVAQMFVELHLISPALGE